MIGFYLVRGHDLDKLVNLSAYDKIAYAEFMRYHQEQEAAKYKALFSGRG